jgi:predicted Ser/Thr protein kinase
LEKHPYDYEKRISMNTRKELLDKILLMNQKGIEHGDLHGGNVIIDGQGHAWIIDPSGIPRISTHVMNRVILKIEV